MLDMYQMQRGAAANVYGEDLQAQHDYAYQQLAQQMAEARLKATPELLKTPGGASLLGPGGIPGMGQDTDPGVMQDAMTRANAAVAAENLQKSGTGLNQLSQGGYGTTPQTASGVTGLPIPAYSGPALAQAATIRGQYQLAGDRIKAAAGGGGGAPITEEGTDPETGQKVSFRGGGKISDKAFNDAKSRYTVPIDRQLPPPALPGGTTVAPSDTTTKPAATPTTQPGTGSGGGGTPRNMQAGANAVQQMVLANQDKLESVFGKDGAADIARGIKANNNMPVVALDPKGYNGWAIVGASGKHY
jgi:hypothetical protein